MKRCDEAAGARRRVAWRVALFCVLGLAEAGAAEDPGHPTFGGRVTVSGTPFTGTGSFRFALVDAAGIERWHSGAGPLALPVRGGRYAVALGDPALGMNPLPRPDPGGLRLRVWFDDGVHGQARVGGDYPLEAAAPPDGDTLLAEIRQLRAEVAALKQAAPTPNPATPSEAGPRKVSVALAEGGIRLGDPAAPVIIVEYSEYECPFCARFHHATFGRLKKELVETGQAQLILRNLPLAQHAGALPAARAALCAWEQGGEAAILALRGILFERMPAFDEAALADYAVEAGLERDRFLAGLRGGTHAPALAAERLEADAAGITATPSFVVGRMVDGKLEGYRLVGALPFEVFAAGVKDLTERARAADGEKEAKP